MKRTWMWSILAMLIAFIPYLGWAQPVATDVIMSKNLLPDSLIGNVNSIWVEPNGDILAALSWHGLVRSRDDGKTWEQIFKKDFLSNFGFAVMRDRKTSALLFGNGGGLYRSSDDGVNWTLAAGLGARCFFIKPNGSILAGSGGYIGQSDNGGVTWKALLDDSISNYFNVEELAMGPKTGSIFAGIADTLGLGVLRSTDDGKTWHQSNAGLEDLHVWSVTSDSNGTLYAGTENGLYRSANDGLSWTGITEIGTTRRWAYKILVIKPDLVFVGFGNMGHPEKWKSGVLKYDGRSWTQIVADSVYLVMSLAVKNGSLLVGTWNAIYRVDGVITAAEDERLSALPSSFRLEQNYPNPFNPTTVIRFSVPKTGFVNLLIFNLLGQEVRKLISEVRPAGSHEIRFDASDLPSGVYLYRLQSGSFTETKRMVLVK